MLRLFTKSSKTTPKITSTEDQVRGEIMRRASVNAEARRVAVNVVLKKEVPVKAKKPANPHAETIKTLNKLLSNLKKVDTPKADLLRKIVIELELGNDLNKLIPYIKKDETKIIKKLNVTVSKS